MTDRALRGFLYCALLAAALSACGGKSSEQASACTKLKNLPLDHTEIVSAEYRSAGHQISVTTTPLGIPWFNMPASCRLKIIIKPTADSHIESEVWIPTTAWNGRLWSAGNGGLAGSIDELSMSLALMRGFATSSTDTGHIAKDQDGRWGLGHPEKLIDFGYRAIHETALQARALIVALQGKPPAFSYFASGSNGGREALAEAQRFPEDYDGIEADAPAFDGSNNVLVGSWTMQQLLKTSGSWFPPSKLPAIAAAALEACDGNDGLKDGLIDDPRLCHPRPETLLCKGEENDSCLTPPQIAALKAIYQGPGGEDPGHFAFYGYEPGSELGWGDWILGKAPKKSVLYGFSDEFHRYLVYGDPSWTLDKFDLATDQIETDRRMAAFYDARDPDLSRFAARGGRLMIFHGWADMALQPRLTIDYYQRILANMGAEAAANVVVLYMVPGMAHGFGGSGPNAFGQMVAPPADAAASSNVGTALMAWVEKGERPGAVIAAKYSNDMKALLVPQELVPTRTRPICLYPQVARWSGKGSVDEAKNFSCVVPSI